MALLIASIALEVAVAVIAVLAARKGRAYLYGLAFTFGAYVFYDLGRLFGWNVEKGILFAPLSVGERERSLRGLESLPRRHLIALSPVRVT